MNDKMNRFSMLPMITELTNEHKKIYMFSEVLIEPHFVTSNSLFVYYWILFIIIFAKLNLCIKLK